jgi:F-type H+/Na+-transporting ATPase subunit alpha
VGSTAQTKAMKASPASLKADHAQFRELQAFAQFGTSDLDAATRRQLERGQRATEVLKQPPVRPLSLAEEVAVIFASPAAPGRRPGRKGRASRIELRKFLGSNHQTSSATSLRTRFGRLKSRSASLRHPGTFKETVPY